METVTKETLHRDLIEQSLKGDESARFELYSLYSAAMYNICLRIVNRREDAEDLLQEAFIEVFDKLRSFRFESSLGSWIKKIVINKCINNLKKRKVKLVYSENLYDPPLTEDEIDYSGIKFKVETVKEAMSELPEGFRVILSLYLFEGYDHTEISGILGISVSTSKTQYMRAKMKLRDLLKVRM